MQDVPTPVFEAYFKALRGSGISKWIEPRIWLEGSRGCWWGAKHHCTFCGLNGTAMAYRSKSAERLWAEMLDAMTRHRTLDLMLADNILDMAYLDNLLPQLRDSGIDARIFAEVKSNLRFDQLARLADARFVQIQPGIENFSTHVLKLMRKGVTGAQNVRLLRDCSTLGISVVWNYLYGFPGELNEYYLHVLRQFPALVHLQPAEIATRVALERFSPYFDDPSLGLVSLGPSRFYTAIHPLPPDVVSGLAYLHDSIPVGIGSDLVADLETALARWRREHRVGGLTLAEADTVGADDTLLARDRRPGFEPRDHRFASGLETTAYLGLLRGRTLPSLRRMLADQGFETTQDELSTLVQTWLDQGLIFEESDTYVALATGAPQCALPFLTKSTDRNEDHRASDDSRPARLLPLIH
jgi:ribosomal peptide maturation radical SAM protein 1